jgi:ribosomal protein S18 acetylase RimI-like enzyme
MDKININLQPFTDADLPALTALVNHWRDDSHYSAETVKKNFDALSAESKNEIWLAKNEKGELLGYVQIGPIYLLTHEPFYEIMQLLVDKTRRSQGVGAAMLEEIEKIVRARGFTVIRLSSRMEREDAHRFYRKNGFVEFKSSRFFEKRLDG